VLAVTATGREAGALQLERRRARAGGEHLQRRVGTQGVEEAGEVCGRGW
jgi:hypothetical protein